MCCASFQGYNPVVLGTPTAQNQETHRLVAGSSPRRNPSAQVMLHPYTVFKCQGWTFLYVFFFFLTLLSFSPSRPHLTKKIKRLLSPWPEPQIASTPLRTAFSSRSRKMVGENGGAKHKNTFPRCHWTWTPQRAAVFTLRTNWTSREPKNVRWNEGRRNIQHGDTAVLRKGTISPVPSVQFCSVLTVPFQIAWQFHVLFWSMSQALDFLSQITRFLTLLVLLLKSRAVSYLQTLRTNVICTAFAQWWCVYVCEDDVITIGLHRDFYMWNRCFPSAILTVNTLTSC